MAGLAKDGILYPASGVYGIDDLRITSDSGWSSAKIENRLSKVVVKHAMKVDALPTCVDNGDGTYTVTYIKDGVASTTNNTEQWFYYLDDNGDLQQTIFLDGEALTIDGAEIALDDYILKTDFDDFMINFQDGVNTIYDAVVLKGQTPLDKSPQSIKNAIDNITTGEGATGVFDTFPYVKMKAFSTGSTTLTCGTTPTNYVSRGIAIMSNGANTLANMVLVAGENDIEILGSHNLPTGANNSAITNINVLEMSRIETMYYFLSRLTKATKITFSGIVDTSKCTNIHAAFYYNLLLEELDLSKFDTSNVTTMTCVFKDCAKLSKLDISKFNTSNVTNMTEMFMRCTSLTELDLTHFDVSKCTTMTSLLNGCTGLTYLNTSGWQLNSLASKSLYLFRSDGALVLNGCTGLKTLIANDMGSTVLTSVNRMLEGCPAEYIELNNLNLPLATTIGAMFYNCPNLTTLSFKNLVAPNVTNIDGLFQSCKKLTNLDLSGFDTSKITTMNNVFNTCSSLTDLDLSMWDMSKVTSHGSIFTNMPALTNLNISNWVLDSITINGDNGYYILGKQMVESTALENLIANNWTSNTATNFAYRLQNCPAKNIYANNWNLPVATTINNLFNGCTRAEIIEVENLYAPKLTNISNAFYGCKALKELDLSSWDVSLVTNFQNFMVNCSSLTYLNLDGWNLNAFNASHHSGTSNFGLFMAGCTALERFIVNNWKVDTKTSFLYMLYKCPAKYIYANNWELPSVTSFEQVFRKATSEIIYASNLNAPITTKLTSMFHGCTNLRHAYIDGWNVPLTTSLYAFFYNCTQLEDADFTGWSDTSKVTTTQQMFHGCAVLKSLDLTPLMLDNVANTSSMFNGCKALEVLDLSSWDTSKVTNASNMFTSVPATCTIKVGSGWTLTEAQAGFAGTFTRV